MSKLEEASWPNPSLDGGRKHDETAHLAKRSQRGKTIHMFDHLQGHNGVKGMGRDSKLPPAINVADKISGWEEIDRCHGVTAVPQSPGEPPRARPDL